MMKILQLLGICWLFILGMISHAIQKNHFTNPPSIYERMVTNSFMLSAQLVGDRQNTVAVAATTIEVDGKHFIGFRAPRGESAVPRYYIGFSQMKDI